MGLFDAIARRFGYQPIGPADYYALQPLAGHGAAKTMPVTDQPAFLRASAAEDAFTLPDRELPQAQLELYRKLTWVQIAIATKAQVAATTPFNVMRLAGEDTRAIANHPFELLLRRPNPLQSRAELLETTFSYYDANGHAYWWLNKANPNAPPDEIWPIPTHRITPVPDGRMYLRGYVYETDAGEKWPLELDEVVHFKRFHPLNQFVGLSPLEALATVAQGDIAAQRWNTNFFAKDNAKIPGILAFSDPIQEAEWDKLKAEVRSNYGGTERRLMMLRNAGKGGVQYIATALSQGDMQFLDGRAFTKEEIFALYAPGLASLLDVNATEANSISGKKTFIEYAVWPHLVRVAEKITSDVLPLYGADLVGEFADIRVTDKQMELAEIAAYGQTHTIDEVRAKYYQSTSIGDQRGSLLVSEVGHGLTIAPATDPSTDPSTDPATDLTANQTGDPTQMGVARKDILGYHIESGVVTRNEARADVGLPPVDDSTDSLLRDLRAKIEVVAAAKNAGLDVNAVATLVGLTGVEAAQPAPPAPQPQPQPPAMAQGMKSDAQDDAQDDTDQEGDSYDPDATTDDGQVQGGQGRQGRRQAEIKALRRWLRNRGSSADPLKFQRMHLSEDDVLALVRQEATQEAATAHPFFAEPTRERWTALKALVLQLDPNEDGAEDRIYRELERRGEQALARAFREQWRGLLPANAETMELGELMNYINGRLLESSAIPDAVSRIVQNGADAGVNIALDQLGRIGVSFDYALVNTRAREWGARYAGELVKNIDDTTKAAIQQSVDRWYGNGEPLSALTADLEPAFDERRARLIAMTETTRAAAEGNRAGYRESGVVRALKWKTNNDERVCPYCGELHDKTVGVEGAFYDTLPPEKQARLKRRFDLPPAHPGCRCRISAEVDPA